MPAIDCDMNPTAIGNDPDSAGRTGLAYLLIAILFFLLTFRSTSSHERKERKKSRRANH